MINIPEDVTWVWAIQISGARMGSATYDRVREIIKKYPSYFPWETKFAKIPQEVHEAYASEILSQCKPPKKVSKGLWQMLQEKPKRRRKPQRTDIRQIIQEMFEAEEKAKKRKERQHKKDKKLWDKHYKKYGLEYRGRL